MTAEELEAQLDAQKAVPVVDGEYEEEQIDEDEQAYLDVKEGIRLLKKSKTLLDFLADGDMIKTITNRDRKVMNNVSEIVNDFLLQVSPIYIDDEEGGE